MENKIITKTDRQFGTVRCIEENGTVLFCAADVAKALGYARPNDAVHTHCLATVKHRTTICGSRKQEINFIPECDVYRLICHSKLPDAVKFEKWVFEDVVPKAVRSKNEQPAKRLTLETAEYHYFPKVWCGKPVITIADFSHFTGIHPDTARRALFVHSQDGKDYILLKGQALAEFKVKNCGISRHLKALTLITKSGVEAIARYYDCAADIPLLEQKTEAPTPTIQPRRKFSAAEHIVALELLNSLRMDFKERLNGPKCYFPDVVNKNIEAIETAMNYISSPLGLTV